jgi:LmbE family N-acetylglucosaminyl deacetylase
MNILVFVAHPDDETMLAGGTLRLLAATNERVHLVCATRGEGGESGDPAVCSRDDLGGFREKEMECAADVLGVHALTWLDYIDPQPGSADDLHGFVEDPDELSARIAGLIEKYRIDAVITHGSSGEYGHPAHIQCWIASLMAVSMYASRDAPVLYAFSAYFSGHPKPRLLNRDQPADTIVSVSTVMPYKIRAALCHRSQHSLFVRRSTQLAGRKLKVPEIVLPVESLHRVKRENRFGFADILQERLRPWSLDGQV